MMGRGGAESLSDELLELRQVAARVRQTRPEVVRRATASGCSGNGGGSGGTAANCGGCGARRQFVDERRERVQFSAH